MAQFRAYTMGKPVLMGRKTWDSLQRKPLPGRANLVWTRDPGFQPKGALAFSDLGVLLAAGRALARDEACIIGGAQLYAAALPFADRVRLTEVALRPMGDAHFPGLDDTWRETARERVPRGPDDDAAFTVRILERSA